MNSYMLNVQNCVVKIQIVRLVSHPKKVTS